VTWTNREVSLSYVMNVLKFVSKVFKRILNYIENIRIFIKKDIVVFRAFSFLCKWICQWTIWSLWLRDSRITTVNPFHFLIVTVGVCFRASEFSASSPWSYTLESFWHPSELTNLLRGVRDSVVIKALCYKPEGRGYETRWGEFLNLPNLSGFIKPWGSLSL
jgi:hypothetical protein